MPRSILTRNEESRLGHFARGGDARARNELVRANVPLVCYLARRSRGPLPLEDKIQEGVTGLIRAAELFDPDRGVRFASYATWWIRQAITRAVSRQCRAVRLPAVVESSVERFRCAARLLAATLGRPPSPEAVAQAVGLAPARAREIARLTGEAIPFGLFDSETTPAPSAGETGGPLSVADPEQAAIAEDRNHQLSRCLALLGSRERFVLSAHYGLNGEAPRTFQQIGDALCLSRERARQIAREALTKLRNDPRVALCLQAP